MKKSLILAGMMSIGYAYAQEGKVGINTENPSATLEITPSVNNAKADAKTNEGILAPRLSKTRIANIETPVEGTLVYATDETTSPISVYTGSDAKVAKITEKGYYFYNGTEWVKTGVNGELWAQRDNNGVTETYLKPVSVNNDEYFYSKNRSYLRLGDIDENLTAADGFIYTDVKNNTPYSVLLNGSLLPTKENASGPYGKYYPIFSREYYKLDSTFSPNIAETPKLRGKDLWYQIKGITKPVDYVIGQNTMVDFQSTVSLREMTSLRAYTTVGDTGKVTTPNVRRALGIQATSNVYSGTVDYLIGTHNNPGIFGGNVKNIFGEETMLNTSRLLPGHTSPFITQNIKDVIGNRIVINNKTNTTAERVFGVFISSTFEASSKITDEAAGFATTAMIKTGSNLKQFIGIRIHIGAEANATIEDLYGVRFTKIVDNNFTSKNMYGLYLDDINSGDTKNYAIYTNAGKVYFGDNMGIGVDNPIEKLEINGALKVGKTTSVCSSNNLGTIKYENDNFYGCKSSGWVLLNN